MDGPGGIDLTVRLLAVGALVLANAFFVASEFALVTVRKTRMDQLVAEGHALAQAVRRALLHPDKYLAAAQLGITMASIALGWVGEPAVAALLAPVFSSLPESLRAIGTHSIAFALAFAIVTSLHIVLGEQVPKIVALQYAEPVALYTTKLTELFMRLCWPFIATLNWVTNRILGGLKMKRFSGHSLVHSEEELKMLVTASQEAGVLELQEEQMLHRVFNFGDLTARHVMVPRTAITGLAIDADRTAVIEQVAGGPSDALPVYRGSLDNIVGVVHVRHLFKALTASEPFSLSDHVQEIPAIPFDTSASRILVHMRRAMAYHAVVIDEYGGTAGIVTCEDLMERIIGDVGGEQDLKGRRMTVLADGSALVDGLMLLTDFNERFGVHADDETYTTVGGFVLGRLGRRPMVGDHFDFEDRTLRVEALDGRRVAWVCVTFARSA
jgi:CBS domain containing-hemolysin-like protein